VVGVVPSGKPLKKKKTKKKKKKRRNYPPAAARAVWPGRCWQCCAVAALRC
jgi:hypothetical protein